MAMEKQKKYCEEEGIPIFAPESGVCWSCHKKVPDQGDKHMTGCPRCHRSWCA